MLEFVGARGPFAHRVYLTDSRSSARHLTATWHPEAKQFVVSHWEGDVCAAAIRLDTTHATELLSLLAAGLADEAGRNAPPSAPDAPHRPASPPSPSGPASRLQRLRRAVGSWGERRRPPAEPVVTTPERPPADVVPLRRPADDWAR